MEVIICFAPWEASKLIEGQNDSIQGHPGKSIMPIYGRVLENGVYPVKQLSVYGLSFPQPEFMGPGIRGKK